MTRVAELFAGYGGLGMAVAAAIPGTSLAWYSEFDPAPSSIMAHHHPGVPNYGDVTAIDWSAVERPDILTGGFPCQDVSVAGRRAGMKPGTRSGLWAHMRYAIDQLRPGLVVIENVGGLFSAEADSRVEPCTYGMGDADGGGHPVLLRAADAVLGDLAALGYDAQWVALRAADVGAPHGRLRVFITAHPEGQPWRIGDGDGGAPADTRRGRSGGRAEVIGVALLPTPSANIAANGGSQDPVKRRAGGHQPSIQDVAEHTANWGVYAPAIERWERVLGRPAPSPTEPGKTRPRLSAAFCEWLMGLPEGHVTAVPGLTRNQQLKALGNGVVPLQAATAVAHLLTIGTERTTA